MNLKSKLKMLVGIVVTLVLVTGLLLYLSSSMLQVNSKSASLNAETFTIGTEYSGIIVKQYIKKGDIVTVGQELFEIKSSVLSDDLLTGAANAQDLTLKVNENNNIVLLASAGGTVSEIAYSEGAFVPANKEIAVITKAGSLYVEAIYKLAPPDYARLKKGDSLEVRLPNNAVVVGIITDISLRNSDNEVDTIVKADINAVKSDNYTLTSGTPVSANLQLNGRTLYTIMLEKAKSLFKPRS